MHLNLIKQFFALLPKKCGLKDNFSERLLIVCPLNCIYSGKNHFNVISAWSEKMSLKNDQLEILFSVFPK